MSLPPALWVDSVPNVRFPVYGIDNSIDVVYCVHISYPMTILFIGATMNTFQTKLYTDLMTLCHPGQEAFYYVDQSWLNFKFRIFLYRLASYTEFLQSSALECRGHVFRIDEDGNALEFVSMPPAKFFNLNENPFVMGLDLSTLSHVMDKLDGSLISTVKVDDQFILKSKGSLNSTQAQDSTSLLATSEYAELHDYCKNATVAGWTVSMEFMSPSNRIVIGYMKPTLKVLCVRNTLAGDYMGHDEILRSLSAEFLVRSHPIPACGNTWLAETYKSEDNIEGFVARLSCGTWFKVKTEKYCALHHTKDSITIPRRLFEACVTGGADDLRAMFATDPVAVMQIDEMDEKVRKIYNRLHMNVHGCYNIRKHLDRKDYAIAGQTDPVIQGDGTFGLYMNLYLGKEANVEEFMVKHYKDYGIKDVAPEEMVEV